MGGKQYFSEQLMSNNSRMQQLKTVTIWWQLHDMHGSKIYLAESIQDKFKNLSKVAMRSKMTKYVENHKVCPPYDKTVY